jgi:ribosomal protein S18 acetylase RimI-like enzyme
VLSHSAIEETLNRWYSEEAMKRRLNSGLIVSVSGGNKVVGFAQHGPATDSVYELFAIYVLPEVLGQGVGWELWKAVRQAARQSGQLWIELWVLEQNSLGKRWYDRQGGQVVGSREIELGGEAHRELRYRFSAA